MAETEAEDEEVLLEEAVATFNGGDYYAAHDLFEALWGEDFYKGLVQAAVALHHYSVGNLTGLVGLPENVDRILSDYTPAYAGLDVERFLSAFRAFFTAVQEGRRPAMADAPKLRPAPGEAAVGS